ncbi:hypothetical protein I7636_02290 [Mycoplasma mycoides subsp. capri]|uniref:hypothetical protein n=1 Tax=Mycoplasma mycoides TaxID=2102 RepID=UPI002240170E|nr:hypothetical protein [Mycoplasma mycoides]QVK01566.1 hypothetical protein I7636_02290 [Mycoplasma mycoides subsp. capri]
MRTKAVFPQRLRKVRFYIYKSLSLIDAVYLAFCIFLGFILFKSLSIVSNNQYRLIISIVIPICVALLIVPTNWNKPEIRLYHQIKWLFLFAITPKRFKKTNKKNSNLEDIKKQKVFKIVSNKSKKVNKQTEEFNQSQSLEQELKELKNLINQQLRNKRKEK